MQVIVVHKTHYIIADILEPYQNAEVLLYKPTSLLSLNQTYFQNIERHACWIRSSNIYDLRSI